MDRDRLGLVAVLVVLGVLGAVLGVWGAFLVPLRLPGGIEGLADVIAFGSVLGAGYLGARGCGVPAAAVAPGIGWIVAFLLLQVPRGGDVVIPASLGDDPGIGTVGTLYFFCGVAGTLAAAVLAARHFRRSR